MLYVLIYSMLSTTSWIPAHLTAMCLFMLSWIHSSPDKCMASPLIFSRNLLKHPCTGKACVDHVLALAARHLTTDDRRRQEHGAPQDCQWEIWGIHRARVQAGIQQLSFCLASPGADPLTDGWSHWVARGLQHLISGLRRRQREAAAVILSCGNRLQDHRCRLPPTVGPWGASWGACQGEGVK